MRRWLHAFIALVTLSALAFAGRGYLYCHMAEQAMTTCCCASDQDEVTPEEPASEVEGIPCCEQRGSDAVLSGATAKLDGPNDGVAIAPEAVAVVVPTLPTFPIETHTVCFANARAPAVARGSPPRRGKTRARFGVMLC